MNATGQFLEYLNEVERRLRARSLAAGLAALAVAALVATLVLVLAADRWAFADGALFWARLGLFLVLGLSLLLGLVVPWMGIRRQRAAELAERRQPGFAQRALTLADERTHGPFTELLAEEALREAEAAPARELVPAWMLGALSAAAAVGAGVLLWLTAAAPGTVGYGARLLWAGRPPAGQGPVYQLSVKPGDARVRRGGDVMVEAVTVGFEPGEVVLKVRAGSAAKWERLHMETRPGGGGYGYLLAAMAETAEYEVEAGRLRSGVHRLTVVDLPGVKQLRVTYRYPADLALASRTEDPGGDLRAVMGTRAVVSVMTDRPLENGVLVFEDGSRIELKQGQNGWLSATVEIRKDGAYHVAALDGGEAVRLSQDYFIEAKEEQQPQIRIARPGRDAKVSPIEEVAVEVQAEDDFGLRQVELHYSVNGGEEKTVALGRSGSREAKGTTELALEEFKLKPGDIVGVYAVARDARRSSRTDMFFLEAQPYEREYSQAQAEGGGSMGGEGDQQSEIAQRQKEIISATWNQVKRARPRGQAEEDAQFLAGLEKKLSEQAQTLAERMKRRELAGTNEEFQSFSKEMAAASQDMKEAIAPLQSGKWKDALPAEQKALQHLLRAEATMRQIQVAFGQRGGGGGGGGGAARDLESLFDLELDKEKNQYETASAQSSSQREKEADEALKKLEELARRQQELAQKQQQQNRQQQAEQRWSQEMLRREAEELRKQMEEMQKGAQSSSSSSQQSSQQASQQGASQQQSGQMRQRSGDASSQRLSAARQQLEKAIEDMRRAQSGESGDAQRAAERMREARDQMQGMRRQQAGSQMDEMARAAAGLTERQRQYEQNLKRAFPETGGATKQGAAGTKEGAAPSKEALERMAKEKEALAGDYQKLEQQMKDAARGLGSTQKQAAERVREALGDAQQSELALRLKLGSDWVRRGLGQYIAPRERFVTGAMEELQSKLEQARAAVGEDGKQQEAARRELAELERTREQLQRGAGQRGGSPQNQETKGGGQQQGGQRGEGDPRAALEGALRRMEQMREGQPEGQEGGLGGQRGEYDRLLREMRGMTQTGGDPATVRNRIEREILPQLEQLELRLRNRLEEGGGAARSQAAPKPPAGYGEAVAEYYRRLSRGR